MLHGTELNWLNIVVSQKNAEFIEKQGERRTCLLQKATILLRMSKKPRSYNFVAKVPETKKRKVGPVTVSLILKTDKV